MNWIWDHFLSLLNLLFGGALVIGALLRLTRRENALVVVLLLFGIAVAAPAILNLMGFIDSRWVDVSRDAVVGIWFIWTSIWALYSPPSPSFPKWTQWAMLVIGGVVLLGAAGVAVHILYYYWR